MNGRAKIMTAIRFEKEQLNYWNGQEWTPLVMKKVKRTWQERLFLLPWRPWISTKEVYPSDWKKTELDGFEGYWLRK